MFFFRSPLLHCLVLVKRCVKSVLERTAPSSCRFATIDCSHQYNPVNIIWGTEYTRCRRLDNDRLKHKVLGTKHISGSHSHDSYGKALLPTQERKMDN